MRISGITVRTVRVNIDCSFEIAITCPVKTEKNGNLIEVYEGGIQTWNTSQLNPLFHTFAEFRPIVIRAVAWQSTDLLVVNAQFSPNDSVNQ